MKRNALSFGGISVVGSMTCKPEKVRNTQMAGKCVNSLEKYLTESNGETSDLINGQTAPTSLLPFFKNNNRSVWFSI